MFRSWESPKQLWEEFYNENFQSSQFIPNSSGFRTFTYQKNTVWDEICDTISGDNQSIITISDDDDSNPPSQEIENSLSRLYQGNQSNNMFSKDYNFLGSNFDMYSNCSESVQLQCSEDYPMPLDLSMKNSNAYFTGNDAFNTSKFQLSYSCKTAHEICYYPSMEYWKDSAFTNNTNQYEAFLPIYNLSSISSNENEVLELMPYENNNALMIGSTSDINVKDGVQSEILDLSMPKRNKNNRSCERLILKNDDIIDSEIVDTNSDDLPDDLPDLRFCDINFYASRLKSPDQRWIYSVRRRLLKISAIRKMFGLSNEEEAELTLLYGGRGLKNPLKSNVPSIANHANYERKYICLYCQKEYKNHKVLSRHYTQHTTYRKFFCVICWKGFYDAYDLKRHIEKHQEITVFYCELCEAIYTQNVSKENHYRKIHKNIFFSST